MCEIKNVFDYKLLLKAFDDKAGFHVSGGQVDYLFLIKFNFTAQRCVQQDAV